MCITLLDPCEVELTLELCESEWLEAVADAWAAVEALLAPMVEHARRLDPHRPPAVLVSGGQADCALGRALLHRALGRAGSGHSGAATLVGL